MAPSVWPQKYTIPKNPFIEGLQNYRDFLQHRFRIRQSNYLNIIGGAIVFPAFIVWGSMLNEVSKLYSRNSKQRSYSKLSIFNQHNCKLDIKSSDIKQSSYNRAL